MVDLKELDELLADYIDKNFERELDPPKKIYHAVAACTSMFSFRRRECRERIEPDKIDFVKLREQAESDGETFSEMLIRLIEKSGEKNSAVYNRANIDRRHFSKIVNHSDYKPKKQTVLAFAVALKLNFDETQKLLAAAGYTLNKTILSDVIVSFFLEHEIFDVDLINETLYKYDLPLLGG